MAAIEGEKLDKFLEQNQAMLNEMVKLTKGIEDMMKPTRENIEKVCTEMQSQNSEIKVIKDMVTETKENINVLKKDYVTQVERMSIMCDSIKNLYEEKQVNESLKQTRHNIFTDYSKMLTIYNCNRSLFEKLTIGYVQYVLSEHFDSKITVSGIESYGKTVQLSFPSIEDTRDAFFCIISLIKKYNSYFDPREKSPRVMFRMPPELEPGLREMNKILDIQKNICAQKGRSLLWSSKLFWSQVENTYGVNTSFIENNLQKGKTRKDVGIIITHQPTEEQLAKYFVVLNANGRVYQNKFVQIETVPMEKGQAISNDEQEEMDAGVQDEVTFRNDQYTDAMQFLSDVSKPRTAVKRNRVPGEEFTTPQKSHGKRSSPHTNYFNKTLTVHREERDETRIRSVRRNIEEENYPKDQREPRDRSVRVQQPSVQQPQGYFQQYPQQHDIPAIQHQVWNNSNLNPPPPGEHPYVQPSTFQAFPSGGQYSSYAMGPQTMSTYMNNI
jgi:hypothetical protein